MVILPHPVLQRVAMNGRVLHRALFYPGLELGITGFVAYPAIPFANVVWLSCACELVRVDVGWFVYFGFRIGLPMAFGRSEGTVDSSITEP